MSALEKALQLSSDAKKYHNWDFCSFITYTVDNPLFEAMKYVLTSAAFKSPNYFKLLRNH